MKSPQLDQLDKVETTDVFFEKVNEAKEQAVKTKPKTYSLPDKHINYIHQKASQVSHSRGRAVSASEALRIIIEENSARAEA